MSISKLYKQFIHFGILSGLGWLLDMATYSLLLTFFDLNVFASNFISSYVGVTFVYFASLRFTFKQGSQLRPGFLLIYWGWQFVSIVLYSLLLNYVADTFIQLWGGRVAELHTGVAAKIFVTPFNLLTNFVFMKLLTRYMPARGHTHV